MEVGLKEYLERVIADLETRINEHFRSGEQAVKDALAAQKEMTSAAFASSEKAIIKAEDAQKSYNERTNELRGTLNDQAKMLLSRTEAEARFQNLELKLEENKKDSIKRYDDIKSDIASLRETRAGTQSKDELVAVQHIDRQWTNGQIIFISLAVLSIIAAVLTAIFHN